MKQNWINARYFAGCATVRKQRQTWVIISTVGTECMDGDVDAMNVSRQLLRIGVRTGQQRNKTMDRSSTARTLAC